MKKIILTVILIFTLLFVGCQDLKNCDHMWEQTQSDTNEYQCSKCKITHLCDNPEEWEKIENLNESTSVYKCKICSTEHLTTDPDSINKPNDIVVGLEGARVWDWHHPDDSERNPEWSIKLASIPNVEFKGENSFVYANDELLIGGQGYGCMSFYTAKLTGTDKTLLCFGMSWGSGVCDERIVIMDFETKQEIFTLSDRANHDYQLFVRNGILCVREIKYRTSEITRTGTVCYSGTNIQIVWDDSVILDEDINQAQHGQSAS